MSLDRIRIISSGGCNPVLPIYEALCDSNSITELSVVLNGDAQAFLDALVKFPPRLRAFEVIASLYKPPPRFYESLSGVDSLEQWKCSFEMSEPFDPPPANLASKLTGFRVHCKGACRS